MTRDYLHRIKTEHASIGLGDMDTVRALISGVVALQSTICELANSTNSSSIISWKFPHKPALSLQIGQILSALKPTPFNELHNQYCHVILLELLIDRCTVLLVQIMHLLELKCPNLNVNISSSLHTNVIAEVASSLLKVAQSFLADLADVDINEKNVMIDDNLTSNCTKLENKEPNIVQMFLDIAIQTEVDCSSSVVDMNDILTIFSDFFSPWKQLFKSKNLQSAFCDYHTKVKSTSENIVTSRLLTGFSSGLIEDVENLLKVLITGKEDGEKKLKKQNSSLMQQLADSQKTKNKLESEITILKAKHTEESNHLKDQLKVITNNLKDSEKECNEIKNQVNSAEEKQKIANKENDQTKFTMNRCDYMLTHTDALKLETQLSPLEQKIKNLLMKFENEQMKVEHLKSQLEESEQNIANSDHQASIFVEKQNILARRISELQTQKEEAFSKVDELEEDICELAERNNMVECELKAIKLDRKNLLLEIARLKDELSSANEQFSFMKTKATEFEKKMQLLIDYPDLNAPHMETKLKGHQLSILEEMQHQIEANGIRQAFLQAQTVKLKKAVEKLSCQENS